MFLFLPSWAQWIGFTFYWLVVALQVGGVLALAVLQPLLPAIHPRTKPRRRVWPLLLLGILQVLFNVIANLWVLRGLMQPE